MKSLKWETFVLDDLEEFQTVSKFALEGAFKSFAAVHFSLGSGGRKCILNCAATVPEKPRDWEKRSTYLTLCCKTIKAIIRTVYVLAVFLRRDAASCSILLSLLWLGNESISGWSAGYSCGTAIFGHISLE